MTTTLTCPDETELLALAMGEPVAASGDGPRERMLEMSDDARTDPGRGVAAPRQPACHCRPRPR